MADWKSILGTGIDAAAYLIPAAGWAAEGGSYALTGKSLGSNIAGDSYVPDAEGLKMTKGKTSKDAVTDFQRNLSISQMLEAAKLKKQLETEGRPVMNEAFDTYQEANDLAKIYARRGMPEEAHERAVTNIERTTSNAINAASSRGAGMNEIGSIYGNAISGFSDLASKDAMIEQNNVDRYLATFNPLAEAAGQKEYYNELLPYEQKVQQMQAFLGAGINNQMNANLFDYQDSTNQQQQFVNLAGATVGTGGTATSAPV